MREAGTDGSATIPEGFPPGLLEALDGVAFAPRRLGLDPRYWWAVTKAGLDFVAHNVPPWNAVLVRLNPYPRPWRSVRVPVGDDGTLLGGAFVEGRPGAPAVLYAPGTFQTKDDTPRKARAIRLHRDLGCHVLVVDMRGFGESHAARGTGGWLEAQDLHAAARWLREKSGERRVALVGDSMGGAASLVAAGLPDAPGLFSSVLAWSPFSDLVTQAVYSGTNPGVRHPYWLPYRMYKVMVSARTRGQARDFSDFLAIRAAELGLPPEDLARRSSPVSYAAGVRVPTLVVHAEDDPIVPVAEAHRYAEAARGNPWVRVRIHPRGAHVDFDQVAPEWYWAATRALVLGGLAGRAPSPPDAAPSGPAEASA